MEEKIELGLHVQDRITGFSGIAIGRASYITGCDQILVQPRFAINGEGVAFISGTWIDEGRLKILGDGIRPDDVLGIKNGADISAPIK